MQNTKGFSIPYQKWALRLRFGPLDEDGGSLLNPPLTVTQDLAGPTTETRPDSLQESKMVTHPSRASRHTPGSGSLLANGDIPDLAIE
jgi:hypothetical protein